MNIYLTGLYYYIRTVKLLSFFEHASSASETLVSSLQNCVALLQLATVDTGASGGKSRPRKPVTKAPPVKEKREKKEKKEKKGNA